MSRHPSPTTEGIDPAEWTRRDEAELRAGRPSFRVGWIRSEALSLGVAQQDDAPCAARARAMGVRVVRRGSGGTAVHLAPADLVWTVVLPRGHPGLAGRMRPSYAAMGAGVLGWLARAGVAARWEKARDGEKELCLLSGRGEVLCVERRVAGGAAQHLTGAAVLHHGVIPFRPQIDRLAQLFEIRAELLAPRLIGYEEYLPRGTPDEACAALRRDMDVAFGT